MRAPIIVLAALALGAATLSGLKWRSARQAKAAFVEVEARQQALQGKIAALETQLAATSQRIASVASDNVLLESAMVKAQAATPPPSPPFTRQAVEDRFKLAREMAANGDPAMALRELLWCWDEGFPRLNASNRSIQLSGVALILGRLAERHPPALAALRERAEKLRDVVLNSPGNTQHIGDLAQLTRALKDGTTLVTLYDQLPSGDERRERLASYASDEFVAARRYRDAMRPYTRMLSNFEIGSRTSNEATSFTIRSAAKDIEVLAGVGDLDHAREFSERVLARDPSPETRALLQRHLERAGQPDLLKTPPK